MRKGEIYYAFIDSQNLNLSIRDAGWKLDYGKLFVFLVRKYQVKKIFLFIGYIASNRNLYDTLRQIGYILVFKPTLEGSKGTIKGNVDAELVLHCMLQYNYFDKAIIVSGDGDFYCLVEYLQSQGKLLKIGIPNRMKFSSLLRKFRHYFFFVSDLHHKLEYKKR